MSSTAEWYQSLPPISKAYGTICLLTTVHFLVLRILHYYMNMYFPVFRLIANLFFPRRVFYLFWNSPLDAVLSIIPIFYSSLLGISLVFMLFYVWSREFPNVTINIYGLVQLKFLTVLHPLAGGKNILKTPLCVHKIVARWKIGAAPISRAQPQTDKKLVQHSGGGPIG